MDFGNVSKSEKAEKAEFTVVLIGVIGSVASIVSLVASTISMNKDLLVEDQLRLFIIKDIFVVVGISAIMTVLAIRNHLMRRRLEILRRCKEMIQEQRADFRLKHLEFPHRIVHVVRDRAYCGLATTGNSSRERAEFFQSLMNLVLDNLKDHLLHEWKTRGVDPSEKVSTTLKLLIPGAAARFFTNQHKVHGTPYTIDNGAWYLITFARDRDYRSHTDPDREREVLQTIYSSNANTAFEEIVHSGKIEFFHNDLRNFPGGYKNENKRWNEFYNAAHAVPVSCPGIGSDSPREVLGVLCADSLNSNMNTLFDTETFQIMSHSADLIALLCLKFPLAGMTSQHDEPAGELPEVPGSKPVNPKGSQREPIEVAVSPVEG